MAKFNSPAQNPRQTVNYEGHTAYKPLTTELTLYCHAACALLEDQYYRSGRDQRLALVSLADSCDPEFVGKLALYLREEMYLRSVPLFLIGALIRRRAIRKEFVTGVIQRADEIKELVSAWLEVEKLGGRTKTSLRPVPSAVRKGLADAFNKFNAFQYRKYNRRDKEAITFKDVLQLVHPQPSSPEMSDTFLRILDGTLEPVPTWETLYSACESNSAKAAVWYDLLHEGKLPYMAALRNIRNILELKAPRVQRVKAQNRQSGLSQYPFQDIKKVIGIETEAVDDGIDKVDTSKIDQTIDKWCELIGDPDAVRKSKQFPFRWLSAYRILKRSGLDVPLSVYQALEAALQASVDNIPAVERFREGRTLIACDSSGSMSAALSGNSKLQYCDVAYVLGELLAHYAPNNVTVGVFGDRWQPVHLIHGGILHNIENLKNTPVGCSTNGYLVAEWAVTEHRHFDTMVFFTDCQLWNSVPYSSGNLSGAMNDYWNKVNPNARIYVFDLAGYGHSPLDLVQKNVFMISGWSDHIFKVLADVEKGELPFWKK